MLCLLLQWETYMYQQIHGPTNLLSRQGNQSGTLETPRRLWDITFVGETLEAWVLEQEPLEQTLRFCLQNATTNARSDTHLECFTISDPDQWNRLANFGWVWFQLLVTQSWSTYFEFDSVVLCVLWTQVESLNEILEFLGSCAGMLRTMVRAFVYY